MRSSSQVSRSKSRSPVRHESDPLSSSVPNISLTPPTHYRTPSFSTIEALQASSLRASLSIARGRPESRANEVTFEVIPSTRESSATRSIDTPSPWLEKYSPRPWQMTPKRKDSVPQEQTEAYLKTKIRVQQAISSILDVTAEVARTGLKLVGEAGEILPVPGLSLAAKLLEQIWDAIEKVDSNRLACLRLSERCAEILLAIYEEIHSSGPVVVRELQQPLHHLQESFQRILRFVQRLNSQPFWKRYLKREEILEAIDTCNASLSDCLYMFNFKVLSRILKNVTSSANRHVDEPSEVEGIFAHSEKHEAPDSAPLSPITPDDDGLGNLVDFSTPDVPMDDIVSTKEEQIREHLRTLQKHQNERDKARDLSDIRQLLTAALESKSDKDMMRILKLARDEVPEAFKTLFRMISVPGRVDRSQPSSALGTTKRLPKSRAFTWPMDEEQTDMLDAELLDRSQLINNLVTEAGEPSWTIRKSDMAFQELVGRGFFSNVYKGVWRQSVWKRVTVAIKVLEPSTPLQDFNAELEIWKSLKHPNILPLFGASSPSEDTKFFISPYIEHGCLMDYLKRVEWSMGLGKEAQTRPSPMIASSLVEESGPIGNGQSTSNGKAPKVDVGLEHELLGWMIEIARGMEYMHSMRIVHGDLKGANILIDRQFRCIIADFGHSKEFSQIDFTNAKHAHGFRWQSPELMAEHSLLTKENDIYAYAITCVEILTMGSLPWPMIPDDLVRKRVLELDDRPQYPRDLAERLGIRPILEQCWNKHWMDRPSFGEIVARLETLEGVARVT
ncbi:hypothetical protein VKT23_010453 [Stygiomarasmius scandens]|uniref:Protein kinase domain-containing protein n=1 Tax=Marasmiellus scandens TaxID=2682957 RepID=A0ABR1JED9_9AGAR